MDLLKAIRKNDYSKIDKILKKGYHVRINDSISDTQEQIPIRTIPLCLATARGQLPIVKLLLYYGADVRACNQDWASPIHLATYRGYEDVIEHLLSHNAEIISSKDQLGDTPLHIASRYSKTNIVKLLLRYNCDTTIVNNLKKTALDTAREIYGEESDVICSSIVAKMRVNAVANTRDVKSPERDGKISQRDAKIPQKEFIAPQSMKTELSRSDSYEYVPPPLPPPRNAKGEENDNYDNETFELQKSLKGKEAEINLLDDDITTCEAEKSKLKADISILEEKVNKQCLLISRKEAQKQTLEREVMAIKKKLRPTTKLIMNLTSSNIEEKSYECPVCLEVPLPPKYVYQCTNGHIYCSECKDQSSMHICPQCRVPLDKQNPIRNIAFSELIGNIFPVHS